MGKRLLNSGTDVLKAERPAPIVQAHRHLGKAASSLMQMVRKGEPGASGHLQTVLAITSDLENRLEAGKASNGTASESA